MRKTTKLYRDVEQIMNSMGDVEEEFRRNPSPRAKQQMNRILSRFNILAEEVEGMMR